MTKPLKNLITSWSIFNMYGDGLRVRGTAMFAQEGVVDAGEVLNTTVIVSVKQTEAGIIVETANSIYVLVVGDTN